MSSTFPHSPSGTAEADAVRIGDVIGSGRHGVVVSATTTDDDQCSYVLKIPSGGTSLDGEAEALKHLAHLNIVRLIDGPSRAGALLLERCDEGTIAERALAPGQAATILAQMADALDHIHGLGWIHGDISPGNIGIRHDGSVALLDFATAQLADGGEIHEGTDDYAGHIRTAVPALDIRCAAASVRARLNDPTSPLADALAALITQCDDTVEASHTDLRELCEQAAAEPVVDDPLEIPEPVGEAVIPTPQRASGGEPPRSATREFGPRPGGDDTEPEPETGEHRWGLVAAVAVAIVVLVAAGNLLGDFTPNAGANTTDVGLTRLITAGESLEIADVDWDDGVAIRFIDDETTQRFAVGDADDVAAVADWNCNGSKTLGVYRPTTGSWFTFDSWDADSVSTSSKLDRGETVLIEETNGCATVRVR